MRFPWLTTTAPRSRRAGGPGGGVPGWRGVGGGEGRGSWGGGDCTRGGAPPASESDEREGGGEPAGGPATATGVGREPLGRNLRLGRGCQLPAAGVSDEG